MIYYTIRGRIGIIFFIGILSLIFLSPYIYDYFFSKEIQFDWENIVLSDTIQLDTQKSIYTRKNALKDTAIILSLKKFSEKDWVRAGISRKAIKSIKKYLTKGGKYTSLFQFKMSYGLTTKDFIIVKNQLAKEELFALNSKDDFFKKTYDLNTIDSATLTNFKGIGAFYAKMIIAYRKRLGGYYSIEQLKEVYKISPELVENIRPYLYCDTIFIKKIYLNDATYFSLLKHPYFNKIKAKKILERISRKGKFQSLQDLTEANIFTSQELHNLSPYLLF